MEIEDKVREFILKHLIVFDDDLELNNDDKIFELGYVDSPFAIELIVFLENECNIQVSDNDLDISNFSSINRIAEFVRKKVRDCK